MTDHLVVVAYRWSDGVTQSDEQSDRWVTWWMDGSTDRHMCRHADRRLGGVGGARRGCKATGSFWRVGGHLDQGTRGLANVGLCTCCCKHSKMFLGYLGSHIGWDTPHSQSKNA